MIGIIIQVVISWLLLWLIDKKDLAVLGLKPTTGRVLNFAFGILLSAICFTSYCLTTTYLTGNSWAINGSFSWKQFFSSGWWTINSVIFEELIFRGALLYLLIQKTSVKIGCWISSIAFGIYHWFSFGVLGNPVPMAYVFLSTGIWGLMFSYSFAKTKSLYLPVGLHLGWNFFNIVIFSQGPLGKQFLVSSNNGQLLTGLSSIGLQLFQVLALPVITYFFLQKQEAA